MQADASFGASENASNVFPLYDAISNSPSSSLYPRMPRLLWESNDLRNGILQVIGWRQSALAVAFDAQSIHKLAEMTWSHVVGPGKTEYDQSGVDHKYTEAVPFLAPTLFKISYNPADPYFTKLSVPGPSSFQGIEVPIVKNINRSQSILSNFSSSRHLNSACIFEARDCTVNYASCRITLHMRYPAATLKFRHLATPPLFSEGPLNDALFSPYMDDSTSTIIPGLFSGWLTMDSARYTVPLLSTDPIIPLSPLVGVWIRGLDSVAGDELSASELRSLQTNGLPKWADMMLSHPLMRCALLRYEEGVGLGEKFFPRPPKEVGQGDEATVESKKPNTRALVALLPPPKVLIHRKQQKSELLASGTLGPLYRASSSMYDTSSIIHVEVEIDWPTLNNPSTKKDASELSTRRDDPAEKSWVMLDPSITLSFRRIPGDKLREMESSPTNERESRILHTVGGHGALNRPVPQLDISTNRLEYVWTLDNFECDMGTILPLSHTSAIWSMYRPSIKWDVTSLLERIYAKNDLQSVVPEEPIAPFDQENGIEGVGESLSNVDDDEKKEETTTLASHAEHQVSSRLTEIVPISPLTSILMVSPTVQRSSIDKSREYSPTPTKTQDVKQPESTSIKEISSSELRRMKQRVPPPSAYYAAFGVKSADSIQLNNSVSETLLIKSRAYHTTSPVRSPSRLTRSFAEPEPTAQAEIQPVNRALSYKSLSDRTFVMRSPTSNSPSVTSTATATTTPIASYHYDPFSTKLNVSQRYQKIREDQLRSGILNRVGDISQSLRKVDSWLTTQKISDTTSRSVTTPSAHGASFMKHSTFSDTAVLVPRSVSPLPAFSRPLFVLPSLSPNSSGKVEPQLNETLRSLSSSRASQSAEEFPRPVRTDPPMPAINKSSSFSSFLRSQELLSPQKSSNHFNLSDSVSFPIASPMDTLRSVTRTTTQFASTSPATASLTSEPVSNVVSLKSPVQMMAAALQGKLLSTSKNPEHYISSPKPAIPFSRPPSIITSHESEPLRHTSSLTFSSASSPRFDLSMSTRATAVSGDAAFSLAPISSPQSGLLQSMRDKYKRPSPPRAPQSPAPSFSSPTHKLRLSPAKQPAPVNNNALTQTIQMEIDDVMRRLEALGDLSTLSLNSIQRCIHQSTPSSPSAQSFLDKTIVPGEIPAVKNESSAFFAERWTQQLSPKSVSKSLTGTHAISSELAPVLGATGDAMNEQDSAVNAILGQVKPKVTSPKISAYSSSVSHASSLVSSQSFQLLSPKVTKKLEDCLDQTITNSAGRVSSAPEEMTTSSAADQNAKKVNEAIAGSVESPSLEPKPLKSIEPIQQEFPEPNAKSKAPTAEKPIEATSQSSESAPMLTPVHVVNESKETSQQASETTDSTGSFQAPVSSGRLTGTTGVFVEYSNDQIKIRYAPNAKPSESSADSTYLPPSSPSQQKQNSSNNEAVSQTPDRGVDIGPICTSPGSPPKGVRKQALVLTPNRNPLTNPASTTPSSLPRSPSNYLQRLQTPQRNSPSVIVTPAKPESHSLDFSPLSTSPSFRKNQSTVVQNVKIPNDNPFATPLARRFSTPKTSRAHSTQTQDSLTTFKTPHIDVAKDLNLSLSTTTAKIQFNEHFMDATDLLDARSTQLRIPSPPSISFPITTSPPLPVPASTRGSSAISTSKEDSRGLSPALVPLPDILNRGESAAPSIAPMGSLDRLAP